MVTEFQNRVYEHVRQVPRGRVTTYGILADRIGCGSCRAVGQALKKNPYAPDVPCHRVISSNLTPGGFRGSLSGPDLDRKLSMLEAEGVLFVDGVIESPERLYRFD